jgi:hypothetical protein
MPSPTAALVDTTVLADCLLKAGEVAARAKKSLKRYDETDLPEYALKEFKAGPLYGFVWLHNKFNQLRDYSAVLGAVQRMSRTLRKNVTSTALEALTNATAINAAATAPELLEEFGPDTSIGQILAIRCQLELRTLVLRAWRKRRKTTTHVTHQLPCLADPEISVKDGLINLGRLGCQPDVQCGLSEYLRPLLPAISTLLNSEALNGDKRETKARKEALKSFSRTPNRPIDERACRAMGDAIFALLAPDGGTILTTNVKDHLPLAAALGKKVESP